MENGMNPLTSLISHTLFVQVTNFRNGGPENEEVVRRIESECAYVGISVIATIETVVRLILAPISHLPSFFQTPLQSESYRNRVIVPLQKGIVHNGTIAIFSLAATVVNPFMHDLDFSEIGKRLYLIRR